MASETTAALGAGTDAVAVDDVARDAAAARLDDGPLAGLRAERVLYVGCGEDLVPLYLFPDKDFVLVDSLNFRGADGASALGPASQASCLFTAFRGLFDFEVDEKRGRAWRPLVDGQVQSAQFVHAAWTPSWSPTWLPTIRAMYFCGWGPVCASDFPELKGDWSGLSSVETESVYERNVRQWAMHTKLRLCTVYACRSGWLNPFASCTRATMAQVPHYEFLILPSSWQWKYSGAWASLKFGQPFRDYAGERLVQIFRSRGVALRDDEDSSGPHSCDSGSSVGPKPAETCTLSDNSGLSDVVFTCSTSVAKAACETSFAVTEASQINGSKTRARNERRNSSRSPVKSLKCEGSA